MSKRTIVTKVVVGTPVRRVTSGGNNIRSITGFNIDNVSGGDILVFQPSTETYFSAELVGGTNLSVTYDSDNPNTLTLNTTLETLSGSIIPDGNEIYDLGSESNRFRDLYLSGSTLNLGGLKLKDSGGSFVVTDSGDNTVFTEVSLTTDNANILSFDSASGMFTFRDSDIARTDIDEIFHKNLTVASGITADSATLGGINLSGNDLTTTGKLYYANVFDNIGDLPSASTYHGMFAHVHSTGAAYFAHAGSWHKLVDSDTTTEQQVYKLKSNDADIATLNFTNLGSDAITAIRNTLSSGTGLTYDSTGGQFSITNTGVTASTYGSATQVPQITINAQGQIDSAGLITIAGVTGVDYDSANGTFTVQTTGGNFSDVITLDPFTTTNLIEGTNQYFTTARARNVLQAGTGVTYDSSNGQISIGQNVAITDSVTFAGLTVSGNFTVSGTTTTINTETINLADNTILLNSNHTGAATQSAGIEVERGSDSNVSLLWDETADRWSIQGEGFVAANFYGNLSGNVTGTVSDISNHSTSDLSEGTNLYYTTARADSDAKNAISVTDAGGDGSLGYNASTGIITYTGPSATEVRAHLVEGTGLTYDSASGVFSITNTGVIAGAYGSASLVPVVTVNAQGQIDSIGTVSVAGVSSTAWDSSTSQFTINTADGGTYSTTINGFGDGQALFFGDANDFQIIHNGSHTVLKDGGQGNLFIEGSKIHLSSQNNGNPIFLTTGDNDGVKLFDSSGDLRLATNSTGVRITGALEFDTLTNTTTDITEGDNLYYTTARADSDARSAISVAGDLAYDSASGVISFTQRTEQQVRNLFSSGGDLSYDSNTGQFSINVDAVSIADSAVRNKLSAGGDLSYDSSTGQFSFTERTDQEVRNLFSASGDLSYDSSTGQFSFDVEQVYTKANFDSDFDVRLGEKTTDNLTEGSTNKYYDSATTETTARYAISVTDAGGDGSLAYNVGTGVITYTGPSATEVRSHFQDGTGVTYDSASGQISIGQSVGTTDDVTFGKVTQDSAVANSIQLNRLQGRPNNTAGTLFFDSDHQKALSVNMSTRENANPDVTLNIGQEIFLYVHNLTGAQINNGDAVYISGTAHGKHPQVSLARANTSTTSQVFGLATMDIPDGGHGWVTRYGLVRDINTSEFTAGNLLFLSPDSDGVVTETPVTVDTGFPHHIGRVVTVDSTNGVILVDGMSEHFDDLRVENKLKATQIEADSASLLNVQFNTTTFDSHQPYSEGLLYYDNKHKTLNYNDDITGMIHEVGTQEHQRVFNNTGSLIRKGQPLYFSGNYTSGDIDVPTVGLADATDVNAYNAQGIAALDIADNSYGHCLIAGQLTEVNTEGLSAGTNFFVGLGPGLVQNASPVYPNFPMCLGWVVQSGDSNTGILLVNQQNHSVNSFRVQTSAHIGTDLQVDGNLTILGSQTTVGQSNVTQGAPFYRLNEGDAIGEAGTTFSGTGLDDAFFAGHFTGTSPQTYYVRIDGVGTGPGGVDTFEVALGDDSAFTSPTETKTPITGEDQLIHSADNISVNFGATTGHDSGDTWEGTASPINVDTGFFTNRNTGTSGVGYTHMGFFFDVSDEKWKLLDEYDSTPTGTIAVTDSSLGIMVAAGFEGPLTGAVTGNASTATALAAGRDFSLTGDITASAVSFDGTGNVQLTTAYNPGSIVNADINAEAEISDSKLATISTAGKVQNSATTATNANTGSTIVARDASGNFEAGTVTLDNLFVGNLHVDSADIVSLARGSVSATGFDYNSSTGAFTLTGQDVIDLIKTVDSDGSGLNADTLDGQEGTYYRLNVYNASGTLLN